VPIYPLGAISAKRRVSKAITDPARNMSCMGRFAFCRAVDNVPASQGPIMNGLLARCARASGRLADRRIGYLERLRRLICCSQNSDGGSKLNAAETSVSTLCGELLTFTEVFPRLFVENADTIVTIDTEAITSPRQQVFRGIFFQLSAVQQNRDDRTTRYLDYGKKLGLSVGAQQRAGRKQSVC
jgi:hypothetical protein